MKQKKMRYDVFLSYRRDGGEETAKHLRDVLTERGYKVFLDVEALRSGPFNQALYDVIDTAKDFILILPPNGLDRCRDENDWVRLEIEHAKAAGKNIVPVMLKGFEFPQELPESIDFVRYQNGPPRMEITFFDAFVDKLQTFLVSKRKSRLKRGILIAAAAILLAAVGFGIYYFNYTYPLTTKDKNLTSDLIAYLTYNLQKYDQAGQKFVKEADYALQFVEEKTTDSQATVMLDIDAGISKLQEIRASLTDVSDSLYDDLKGSRYDLGDIGSVKTTLYALIDSYTGSLTHVRDTIVGGDGLRKEFKTAYLQMLKDTAQLDAEIVFYLLNDTLLPVTNDSALTTLKNTMLPTMPFVYAKRLDLTRDAEALHGKEEAAFRQYEQLVDAYQESIREEEDYFDVDSTLAMYDRIIAYQERHGIDSTEMKEKRESFREKAKLLEEKKLALLEEKRQLEEKKQEAYEKYKPLEGDDLGTLWFKGQVFLYIKMPEAAAECYQMFIETGEGDDKIVGNTGLRFAQAYMDLDFKGGVVVYGYEEDQPHQAVEIGDIIYEVDGNPIYVFSDYAEAVSQKGVHSIRILRFTDTGYELTESVINSDLGKLVLASLGYESE